MRFARGWRHGYTIGASSRQDFSTLRTTSAVDARRNMD
jgi:hypothetical protein